MSVEDAGGPAAGPDPAAEGARELAEEEERHASWLELFFDLLFVAIVAQFSHSLVGHVTLRHILAVAGLFFAAWWMWVSVSYFSDIGEREGAGGRVGILGTMACLVVFGGGVAGALHGHPAVFAVGAGLTWLVLPPQWLIAMRAKAVRSGAPSPVVPLLATAAPYLLAAVAWLASAAVPPPGCYGVWALAVALTVVPSLSSGSAAVNRLTRAAMNGPHIVERFGLFVIIVLGEGIAQIVAGLGGAAEIQAGALLTGVAAFALLAVVWWLYFDFGSAAALTVIRARPERIFPLTRDGFAFGHYLLVGGILAASAGLGSAVAAATAHEAVDASAVRLVCGGLLVYLVNNAIVGVAVLRQSARSVLRWLVPDAAAVAVVAALAGRLAAGWAFVVLAVVVAGVAGSGAARRRRVAAP